MAEKKIPKNLLIVFILSFVAIVGIAFSYAVMQGRFEKRQVDFEEKKKIEKYETQTPPTPEKLESEATRQETEFEIAKRREKEKKLAEKLFAEPDARGQVGNIDDLAPPLPVDGKGKRVAEDKAGSVKSIVETMPASAAGKNMVLPEIYENYSSMSSSKKEASGGSDGAAKTEKRADPAEEKRKEPSVLGTVTPDVAPSRYYLREGSVIDVVLLNGINTQNPGRIQLRTVTDIYDSLGDRRLLIPKGSVLVGGFGQSVSQAGLDRIPVGIHRIMLPDGRSIKLAKNPVGDEQGFEGIPAEFHSNILTAIGPSAIVAWLGYWIDKKQAENHPQTTSSSGYGTTQPPNISQQVIPKIEQKISERFGSAKSYYTVDPGVRLSMVLAEDVEVPPYSEKQK